MALTPEEIVGYDLKQSVRGYSISQVDDLLDQLADQVEATDARVQELTDRLRRADERLTEANETEAALKRTLVTAQQTAERSVAEAREEAARLVAEAERQAEEIRAAASEEYEHRQAEARERLAAEVEQARSQRAAIEERIDALASRERQLRERLRRDLQQQLAELDADDARGVAGSPGDAEPQPATEDGTGPSGLRVRVHGAGADTPSPPLGSAAHDEG